MFEVNIEETLSTFVTHSLYIYVSLYISFNLMNYLFDVISIRRYLYYFFFLFRHLFRWHISGAGNAGYDRSTRKRRGSQLFVCHGAASSGTRCMYIDKLLLCDSRFLASVERIDRHLLPCSFICKPMPLVRQIK